MAQQLQDFLECIENVPSNIQDALTDIRTLDLEVEISKDALEKDQAALFKGLSKKKISPHKQRDLEGKIKKHCNKMKDASNQKVRVAEQQIEMLKVFQAFLDARISEVEESDPHLKKLRPAIEQKFDKEDEEKLKALKKHKRSGNAKHKLKQVQNNRRNSNASSTSVEKSMSIPKTSNNTQLEPQSASVNSGLPAAQASPSVMNSNGLVNSAVSVKRNIGPGGNAIAAAASQAIAATQQMQQGRRTASLKASYEAVNNGGVHASEFSRELAGAAQTAIAAIQESSKKNKKKNTSANVDNTSTLPVLTEQVQQQAANQQQSNKQPSVAAATTATAVPSANQQNGTTANSINDSVKPTVAQANAVAETENHEWIFDPNEPRYCICNQVSYGEMVACDNADCPVEWFHYPCVNITSSPKGKWYCPQCATTVKRRAGRKNN